QLQQTKNVAPSQRALLGRLARSVEPGRDLCGGRRDAVGFLVREAGGRLGLLTGALSQVSANGVLDLARLLAKSTFSLAAGWCVQLFIQNTIKSGTPPSDVGVQIIQPGLSTAAGTRVFSP